MKLIDSPKDCIRTNSGIYINIFNPKPEMFCIEDIAHALAEQPRFAGHLNRHYSVAQHSVLCARMVKRKNRLPALMHDASEAYMLDMPTPIKAKMPEYKEIEHELMQAIADKFDFPYPYSKQVKKLSLIHI